MLEKVIEKKVSVYAVSQGWVSYKFTSPQTRGVPDRIYFKGGKTILIEFKAEGKEPTKLQEFHIDKIKNQGIPVFVIDSIEAGEAIFNAEP